MVKPLDTLATISIDEDDMKEATSILRRALMDALVINKVSKADDVLNDVLMALKVGDFRP